MCKARSNPRIFMFMDKTDSADSHRPRLPNTRRVHASPGMIKRSHGQAGAASFPAARPVFGWGVSCGARRSIALRHGQDGALATSSSIPKWCAASGARFRLVSADGLAMLPS